MTRAVMYMRKSVDDETSHSFQFQERDSQAYAGRKGYAVVAALSEPGQSGHDSLDTRPVLKEVRRMVRSNEVDVVLVWRYDRLARDFLDQAFIIRESKFAGVRVESVTEPIPDGPMGWVIQAMHGGMSEQEWHNTRQRLASGIRERVEKGMYLPGSKPPYGYLWADSRKSRLMLDPLTAPVVVRIFDLLAGGMSVHAVANLLSQERIPSPTGKSYWSFSVLCRLVRKPLYWGEPRAFWTHNSTAYAPHRISGELKQKSVRQWLEGVEMPLGIVPALVSPEVAQRAHLHIKQRAEHPPSSSKSNLSGYLLRGGFLVCGVCGCVMTVRGRGHTEGAQSIYRCAQPSSKYSDVPHALGITMKQADDWVWSSFVESVSAPGVVTAAMSELDERRESEILSHLKAMRSLLDDNREQQACLVQTLTLLKQDGATSRITHQLDTLSEEEGRILESIAEFERKDIVLAAARDTLRRFSETRDSTKLSQLSTAERRRLLFDFGVRVTVRPIGKGKRNLVSERCDLSIDVLARAPFHNARTVTTASRGTTTISTQANSS
jgi:DNA invertase Pin-like site-specific DNA recombinase